MTKKVLSNAGDVVDVTFHKPIIMMNSSYLTACKFIFAVACVCHEMIHYYDHFSDEYVKKFTEYYNGHVDSFNSHHDAAFQEKMHEARRHGIDVVEDHGRINTFGNINAKARWKLYDVVGESSSNVYERFDGHTLVVRNKKTGNGFFAMFD